MRGGSPISIYAWRNHLRLLNVVMIIDNTIIGSRWLLFYIGRIVVKHLRLGCLVLVVVVKHTQALLRTDIFKRKIWEEHIFCEKNVISIFFKP